MTFKTQIIIAHPNPTSFNVGLAKLAEEYCHLFSTEIVMTDIYAMYANKHPAVKPFGVNHSQADQKKISQEKNKLKSSQFTLIQFPLYWYSFPGLLKNYLDTILELEFAHPRRVMLSITTQGREEDFSTHGLLGAIETILYPLELTFSSIGYEILPYFVAYNVTDKSQKELEKTKQSFIKHINHWLNFKTPGKLR
jgi:NAD(P)H dehydrogenase (quinone)